jgi:acyl-CoA thioesterase
MRAVKAFFENDAFARHCGVELLEVSDGHARARLATQDYHRNGSDLVHGGAIFTLAESAFAAAANSHGAAALAISANISYITAVTDGSLLATAREVSLGPELATYAIEVTDESKQLVAVFEGTAYLEKPTTAE